MKSGNRSDISCHGSILLYFCFQEDIWKSKLPLALLTIQTKKKILYQNSFRSGYSTEPAVFEFMTNVYKYLDSKQFDHVVGVFIDLSKTFDYLSQAISTDKLKHYRIREIPLQLFKSYICIRSQAVYCNTPYSLQVVSK